MFLVVGRCGEGGARPGEAEDDGPCGGQEPDRLSHVAAVPSAKAEREQKGAR